MTEQEFYQQIRAELDKAADDDSQLSALLKKIQSGNADFADTAAYWQKWSQLVGNVLSHNIVEPGTGKNELASYLVMKNGHYYAYNLFSIVQKSLDEQQNIHIKAQKPKFPEERARQVAQSLEDKTVEQEVIERRARNAVANVINTFHDDYVETNAQFRHNAGLKCTITRLAASGCCKWCDEVSGRFEYGSHPKDIFRRHDGCPCVIIYKNDKFRQRLEGVVGTRKNKKGQTETYKTKAWEVVRERPRAQYKPTVFSSEQARETERKNLQYKGLAVPADAASPFSFSLEQVARTPEELQKVAEQVDHFLNDYATRASKWSGNAFRMPKDYLPDAMGKKEWNCNILIREDAGIKTVVHELLHARSCSHFDRSEFAKHRTMEEATVELYAQEICKRNRIFVYEKSYTEIVDCLRDINKTLQISQTDFDFAQKLLDMDMRMRYNWIKEVYDKAISENSVGFLQRISLDYNIEFLGSVKL